MGYQKLSIVKNYDIINLEKEKVIIVEKLFLAKIENSDDRDVVYYLDFNGVDKNGYFSNINLNGSCFSGFKKELLDIVENDFDSLETIYTKDEIKKLFELDDELTKYKHDINANKEKVNEMMLKISNDINCMLDKLRSGDNEELFQNIVEEEKVWCMNEYNLSKEQIDDIFDNYNGNYQDRSIICTIYEDKEDMFDNLRWNGCIEVSDYLVDYVDKERYISDILEEDNTFYELSDGRIVYYSY